jgi:hypothetical protein
MRRRVKSEMGGAPQGGGDGHRIRPVLDVWSPSHYWITSSARASTDGGIVRPRAFAVFMLMTNSEVLSFDKSQLAQALTEGLQRRRAADHRRGAGKVSDPRDLS